MIISHSQVENALKLYRAAGSSETKTPSTQEKGFKPTGGQDRITLSDEFEEFRVGREAYDSAPVIREEKVAHLKELIEKGDYKIDSAQVAEKIVDRHIIDILA